MKKRLFIYDFETNGWWHPGNQPIEVAIRVIEKNGEVINYNKYISCDTLLSVTIEDVTGITDMKLAEEGEPIEQVFKEVDELIDVPDTLVIGHSIITFDNLFLNHRFNKYGYKAISKDQCFDTAGQMKAELMKASKLGHMSHGQFHANCLSKKRSGLKYSLRDACKRYKIPIYAPFHRAHVDVDYTEKIFLKQAEKLKL